MEGEEDGLAVALLVGVAATDQPSLEVMEMVWLGVFTLVDGL